MTPEILREFFNAALSGLVPDPATNPPVYNVNWDGSGRFAFVEFRTIEVTDAAILLDKVRRFAPACLRASCLCLCACLLRMSLCAPACFVSVSVRLRGSCLCLCICVLRACRHAWPCALHCPRRLEATKQRRR